MSQSSQTPNGSAHSNPGHPKSGQAQNGEDQVGKQHSESDNDNKDLQRTPTKELRQLVHHKKRKIASKKEELKQKSKPPGGFDETPLPDAPQGYTLKFTFHRAFNLPIADLRSKSSDPFLHATLLAAVPKRHKEDPPLTRRTRTLRRTTAPEWEEKWVVANVPASGFTLKCRIYDEDWPDHDDRLGNVTIRVFQLDENWEGLGPDGRVFEVKKRSGSKRAYLFRSVASVMCGNGSITPRLHVSIDVLGKSDPPHAQMYTVEPTTWVKHYSPMIGRLTGVKVNRDEEGDGAERGSERGSARKTQKYDFQANEIQLSGPVPPKLYHRYVEFRPIIGRMFSDKGLRGRVLNKVLHKQHNRIYNFDSSTEYGTFPACSEEATLQFLRMAHFDAGGRIFTYVLTLDGMLRFTETGKEFGIDLLSKHTMHSDVATYIACAGEFFIRRLAKPVDARSEDDDNDENLDNKAGDNNDDNDTSSNYSNDANDNGNTSNDNNDNITNQPTHPATSLPNGPPSAPPPPDPHLYQLIIDNDSGTYRPDKSVLPLLAHFLRHNLPGLHITALHCADENLTNMKKEQAEVKQKEGTGVRMVLNRSPSGSSLSSDDEDRLGALEALGGDEEGGGGGSAAGEGLRSRKERVFDLVMGAGKWTEVLPGGMGKGTGKGKGKERE